VDEPGEDTRTITSTNDEGEIITSYEHLEYPTIGNMDQIYRVIEDGESVFYI
jgi:hypothetical protein